MRLGAYPCTLKKNSKAHRIYKKTTISERHRHRYEFNNVYQQDLETEGLIVTGKWSELAEIIELKEHPWMIGVQFHPEFQSKPTHPHPLFVSFIEAALHTKK